MKPIDWTSASCIGRSRAGLCAGRCGTQHGSEAGLPVYAKCYESKSLSRGLLLSRALFTRFLYVASNRVIFLVDVLFFYFQALDCCFGSELVHYLAQ